MNASDIDAYLAFFRAAGALNDTLRNSWTAMGRRESTAEHTWRLCLIAVALEDDLTGVDLGRLLHLLVLPRCRVRTSRRRNAPTWPPCLPDCPRPPGPG